MPKFAIVAENENIHVISCQAFWRAREYIRSNSHHSQHNCSYLHDDCQWILFKNKFNKNVLFAQNAIWGSFW